LKLGKAIRLAVRDHHTRSLYAQSPAQSEQSCCWFGRRRIISGSAENRGSSCPQRSTDPRASIAAEILALGPSCASPGVVRYIGKGKDLRLYSHMKEVRSRLNRHYRLRNIGSRLQQNLTKAVLSGAKVIERVLADNLTETAAYNLEYDKLREYVFAGKRDQLWNVILRGVGSLPLVFPALVCGSSVLVCTLVPMVLA
jgi:hypothetical protein